MCAAALLRSRTSLELTCFLRFTDHYVWWTIYRWLRKDHPKTPTRELYKQYAWCKPRGLKAAMQAEDLVLGGGNVEHLKQTPESTRLGDNANAFAGGHRMWKDDEAPRARAKPAPKALPKRKLAKRKAFKSER